MVGEGGGRRRSGEGIDEGPDGGEGGSAAAAAAEEDGEVGGKADGHRRTWVGFGRAVTIADFGWFRGFEVMGEARGIFLFTFLVLRWIVIRDLLRDRVTLSHGET